MHACQAWTRSWTKESPAPKSPQFPVRPAKPKGQGAERREEILDAAQACSAKKGVHAVSTRQIAEVGRHLAAGALRLFRHQGRHAAELCVRAFAILGERMGGARVGYTPTPRISSAACGSISTSA
jgi:hypothetical protein